MKIIVICYYAIVIKEEKNTPLTLLLMKTHIVQQTKHQVRHNVGKHVDFTNAWNCMEPLNGENKLQIDKKDNKNWKNWKILKNLKNV